MPKFVLRIIGATGTLCFFASWAMGLKTGSQPHITTLAFPDGVTGQPYSASLSAKPNWKPYMWSIVGGSLPPGLVMNTYGVISGIPCSSSGSWWATFQVTDTKERTARISLCIFIAAGPLQIITTSLPSGTVGVPYSAQLQANGGAPAC